MWFWVLVILAWICTTLGSVYTLAAQLRERNLLRVLVRPRSAPGGGGHRLAVGEAAPWMERDRGGGWHHGCLSVGDCQN